MKENIFEHVEGNQFKVKSEGIWDTAKNVVQGVKQGFNKGQKDQANAKFVQDAHQVNQRLQQELMKLRDNAVKQIGIDRETASTVLINSVINVLNGMGANLQKVDLRNNSRYNK